MLQELSGGDEKQAIREVLAERLELLEELKRRAKRNALVRYQPYTKQRLFHALGATKRERLLMAGNQVGKTYCGAAEVAMHLTGLYPDWWQGRRWDRPTRWWAASVTAEVTRDAGQRLLLGDPVDGSALGTGLIPGDMIGETRSKTGIPNALASASVKHVSGEWSSLVFKSYDQRREKFQGDTLDGIWLDEEPPLDIYTECLTRTNATGGMVFMTFTPLMGMSKTVKRFTGSDVERH